MSYDSLYHGLRRCILILVHGILYPICYLLPAVSMLAVLLEKFSGSRFKLFHLLDSTGD